MCPFVGVVVGVVGRVQDRKCLGTNWVPTGQKFRQKDKSRAPRSHQVKPGATAPWSGEGTTATGKPTGARRATGQDEERRTNAGPRGTPERHAAGHNNGTRTGAKPQRPLGAANSGSAHNTRRTTARDKVPRTAGPPHPHTAPTASGKRAPAARPKGRVVGGGRVPVPGRPTPRQESPPPGPLVPPP